jgi:hypothetical protein
MLAQCLGTASVRAGHSVVFTRNDALLKDLGHHGNSATGETDAPTEIPNRLAELDGALRRSRGASVRVFISNGASRSGRSAENVAGAA